MARAFGNASANRLTRITSVWDPTDPRPCSLSIWLNGVTQATFYHPFSNNYPTEPNFSLEVHDNNLIAIYSGNQATPRALSSTFTLPTGVWTHLGVSWNTNDDVAFYLNGAAHGTGTLSIGACTPTDAAVIGTVDNQAAGFWDTDGSLAEFAGWNVVLAERDFRSIYAGVNPLRIRPSSLIAYVPIQGGPGVEHDLVSRTSWAINGTLPSAPHAPVSPPGFGDDWAPYVISAAQTHAIEASLSGTGSLTANPQSSIPISASLSGTGNLAANPQSSIPISAALAGTGSLTATLGASQIPVSASLNGTGNLSSTLGASDIPLTASLAGTGNLSATLGASTIPITASLSGTGALTANFTLVIPISASLSGTGTLTATLEPGWPDTTLSGTGTLTATLGASVIPTTSALSGTGTLVANTQADISISASLSGSGSLTATLGTSDVPISAVLPGTGALTANFTLVIPISVALSGTGTLTANLGVVALSVPIEALLSGVGTLTANVVVTSVIATITFYAQPRSLETYSSKRILSGTAHPRNTVTRARGR